ncbi:MAG: TrmJ/YjtD family RNA methyltransferase [Acidobacteria bacterium]|nr:TrmJ/YjtD family RNA methyltransferase [Acidobacteriota bacterium]MBW4044512.1 TrmJ/YjtD family RNA methyltransferase [Acidobacteriota bacterium]
MAELIVVLVRTRNPLNIGAAARAMSNFGISQLRVVQPYEAAFREARSAVGAARLLAEAQEFTSVAEAVADCSLVVGTTAAKDRELHHPLLRLEQAAPLLRQHAGAKTALLFGSEKTGLSIEDMSHCHWLLRIPTREEHSSMNLGQAVAICLYEMVRQSPAAHDYGTSETAPQATLERLTAFLYEALVSSGYVKGGAEDMIKTKVRRLVRRLSPNANDADLLLGMLRKIARLSNPSQN